MKSWKGKPFSIQHFFNLKFVKCQPQLINKTNILSKNDGYICWTTWKNAFLIYNTQLIQRSGGRKEKANFLCN